MRHACATWGHASPQRTKSTRPTPRASPPLQQRAPEPERPDGHPQTDPTCTPSHWNKPPRSTSPIKEGVYSHALFEGAHPSNNNNRSTSEANPGRQPSKRQNPRREKTSPMRMRRNKAVYYPLRVSNEPFFMAAPRDRGTILTQWNIIPATCSALFELLVAPFHQI